MSSFTRAPGLKLLFALSLLSLLMAGLLACSTPAALPTVAPTAQPPAPLPPTPLVVVPTPTSAREQGSEAAGETNTPMPIESTSAGEGAQPTPTATAQRPASDDFPITPALLPSCSTPGRIEQGTLDSAVAGQPMRYRVYLPPCYGQDGHVYPTLYLFGGNIHDDAFWDALGIDEAAEAAITAGAIPPLLIVMPDNGWLANTTTSGPASYEGFVLNELIPHIEKSYCAWSAQAARAVGGVSRGGYWSLMMAFRRPDVFRSVAAHSPALIDDFAGPAEDPRVTGVVNDLGDLRIWIDIGQRDPYLVQAQPLHDALAADGVAHEWRVEPGIHEPAYWQARLNDYLLWYSAGWPTDRATLPDC